MKSVLSVMVEGIRSGDRTTLSKAITLAESSLETDISFTWELLEELSKHPGHALRIAVTGPPGAGKSTLINSLGQKFIEQGSRVAVLTIDPSSQKTGGSILADKTRMHELSGMQKAFIRPSPSAGLFGGLSPGTRAATLLCEAAGFDIILIETVGVGQSEVAVRELVDCVILVLIPGSGDELQGLKKGIMENADLILVNKADGATQSLANKAVNVLNAVLRLSTPEEDQRLVSALPCSAENGLGIEEVMQEIRLFFKWLEETGFKQKKRSAQRDHFFEATFLNELQHRYLKSEKVKSLLISVRQRMKDGNLNEYEALKEALKD
ncbi:MAG: methylmalonyl Co-A mutase-associated GTPase MeaB [Bacteroidetes bacterium]|nr:methylmalonyl Co-A mutase-associated GTPase MeaB [Bacteroidota bacterium]